MEGAKYNSGDFYRYLLEFRCEKGSAHTHTSIVKPPGAFYIPFEEEAKFFKLYKAAMKHGEDLHMTEKHRSVGPIVIDLDFRHEFDGDSIRRYVTSDHIEQIVNTYVKVINEYLDIKSSYEVFVLQKPHPVRDKDVIKDGIHIIIPNVVTKPGFQYFLRQKVLRDLENHLDDMNLKNAIEDVVDEAVIERNNWQMYGSKKPNCDLYKVTELWVAKPDGDLERIPRNKYKECELVELLSIRNKVDEIAAKIEKAEEVREFEQNKQKSKKMKIEGPAFQANQNLKKNMVDNIEYVKKVVDLLDVRRAESYTEWIRVGWCLRNIDYRLLDTWIEFSKKSPKFNEGECEKMWSYMKDDGLGMGSLYMWAKQDNPTALSELQKTDLGNLIFRSTSETHHDIAKVVHFMFKYDFVCSSIKNNYWYEFKNHRWESVDNGFALRKKISDEVVREYSMAAANFNARAAQETVETEQQRFLDLAKRLNGIALKLKQCPFKENILKECRDLFYVEKFEEKLDSKSHLLGFTNGVYDLIAQEFREGRPDDYISLSCGINYVPYDATNSNFVGVNKFLSQIFTKPHIKEYVLLLLASFLNGGIKEERFHIWTGTGANGKSKLIELFEMAFGEYCCKFPITLLTQKRAASNAATSELARAKGKRFACLQEPGEDEKLNIGLMKELTGGDKIMARLIYKEPIEFKPQFKMILTCNHLPNVPSDDGGTWRRLRVVEFTSKFTDTPNPENENEFPIDMEISKHFEDWKECFMSLLIEYYKKYMTSGISEPDEVLKCTKEYQKNNDVMLEFVESEFEKNDQGFITISDVLALFKSWVKDSLPNFKIGKKKDLIMGMSKTFGKHVTVNRVDGWKGWRFKQMMGDGDDYLD